MELEKITIVDGGTSGMVLTGRRPTKMEFGTMIRDVKENYTVPLEPKFKKMINELKYYYLELLDYWRYVWDDMISGDYSRISLKDGASAEEMKIYAELSRVWDNTLIFEICKKNQTFYILATRKFRDVAYTVKSPVIGNEDEFEYYDKVMQLITGIFKEANIINQSKKVNKSNLLASIKTKKNNPEMTLKDATDFIEETGGMVFLKDEIIIDDEPDKTDPVDTDQLAYESAKEDEVKAENIEEKEKVPADEWED